MKGTGQKVSTPPVKPPQLAGLGLIVKKITKKLINAEISEQWPHNFEQGKAEGIVTLNISNNKTPHPLGFQIQWTREDDYGEDLNYNNFYFLKIRCPDLDAMAQFEHLEDGYMNLNAIVHHITEYIYNLK